MIVYFLVYNIGINKDKKMMFLIDKYFIEKFNSKYGTNLTYKEFVDFQKKVREEKKKDGKVSKYI